MSYNPKDNQNNRVFEHYSRIIKCVKDILNDDELDDEEKIRMLGTIF